MTGCGRQIRYVLDGRAYYTPYTSHDTEGRCQGLTAMEMRLALLEEQLK